MKFKVKKSQLKGEINIPGSKSHTIRALIFAMLANGKSEILHPLISSDTLSCLSMIEQFGAKVEKNENSWIVSGVGSNLPAPEDVIDVGNSGTTLYMGVAVAALIDGATVFTGDSQIRNRPAKPLIDSINDLGGEAFATRSNGKPPVVIKSKMKGGKTTVEAVTSQYLSALLMATPLLQNETEIDVPLLNEKPYVTMTLNWLDKMGIDYENRDYNSFLVKGGQTYSSFNESIAADFSSATFFLVAASITGADLLLKGLDFTDTQGDKEVVKILEKMGSAVEIGDNYIRIKGQTLRGGTFDLNAIPDALPALAVAGCFAEGETRLINVSQARVKETDRISVMCEELKKMGADIEELDDGLVIRKSKLVGTTLSGHHDHRVVMSLSVAGMIAEGETLIDTAESASVTFPEFKKLMNLIGAKIEEVDE